MRMVAQVATKLGPSRRFKCTCGHSEDFKEDHPLLAKPDEVLDLEGFHEMPD